MQASLDMEKTRQLDYLDESFAPAECDDADICWRAFVHHGWRCGVVPVEYLSDLHWGTMRIEAGQSVLGAGCVGVVNHRKGRAGVQNNWCKITETYGHFFTKYAAKTGWCPDGIQPETPAGRELESP